MVGTGYLSDKGNARSPLCNKDVVEIPTSKDGIPITEIGAAALQDINNMKKLIIRAPITKIGENGIRNLILDELYLPPTLKTCDNFGIYHSNRNISIVFPTGINLENVGGYFLGEIRAATNIYYCGYNNVTYGSNQFLRSDGNITIFVPPGGPSTFLGKNTTELKPEEISKCYNPYFVYPVLCPTIKVGSPIHRMSYIHVLIFLGS